MNKDPWEIQYNNWLSNDDLDDTEERREAFKTGYQWALEEIQDKLRRL